LKINNDALMNARSLPPEDAFTFYDRPDSRTRRSVLRATVEYIGHHYESLHLQAGKNLAKW